MTNKQPIQCSQKANDATVAGKRSGLHLNQVAVPERARRCRKRGESDPVTTATPRRPVLVNGTTAKDVPGPSRAATSTGSDSTAMLERLQRLRDSLETQWRDHAADLCGGETSPEGDQPGQRSLQSISVATISHIAKELGELDSAVDRVVNGLYGICADCGGAIPRARLAANPVASRCTACQEAYELRKTKR